MTHFTLKTLNKEITHFYPSNMKIVRFNPFIIIIIFFSYIVLEFLEYTQIKNKKTVFLKKI